MSTKQRLAPSFVTKCLVLAASAENKNEDSSQYEKEVVELYRSLEMLDETLEVEGRTPSEDEKQRAAEWLQRLLTAKQLHPQEWTERMEELWSFSNSCALVDSNAAAIRPERK
ncbi:hypothetical protein NQ117_08870 [Paenibacillus sp. SC116]|uniref:hypothetical protein n=1 Tax=Paenibacillus sp. SC116 TaxID=2968986 RepID=UPI00215B64E7|nr:hypothetical protein [Paenibacillus sp. SC116]MCR8843798.1 hypothetical protein [Paenibacillus sp. SC116]